MEQSLADLGKIIFLAFVAANFIFCLSWVFMSVMNAWCHTDISPEEKPLYSFIYSILLVMVALLIQNSDFALHIK